MAKLKLEHQRWPWLPTLLVLAATLIAFAPVIFGGGFFWDDYDLLVNNPAIHATNGLLTIWFSRKLPDYFPLTSTMFWIEWRLFGPTAAGAYHLVNVLLHAGTAILLWRVLRRLRVRGAVIAALLFALHPVNAESAAWIAEGKNTLSLCLAMGALLLWLRSESARNWGLYAGAVALFLLALLAKTSVVMLPVAMVLLLWYRRRATLAALLRTAPFFAISLALGLVTMWFQAHRSIADTQIRTDDLASRVATAGWSVWWYLGKAIFPVNITFSYPTSGWAGAARYGAIAFVPAALVAIAAVVLWALHRKIGRGWATAFVIYVVMLLPILGLVNVYFMRYSLVSNHWQYASMPAFCAAVGAVVAWVARRGGVVQWNSAMVGALAVLALLALDTFTIAAVYRTPEGVWNDVLAHDPDSWLAHARLGEMDMEAAAHGDPQAALAAAVHLRKVVDLRPDLMLGYTNLGNAYVAMGRPREAEELYRQGLAAPTSTAEERALLHVDLGTLQARMGDAAGAEQEFVAATQANPKSTTSWLRLGMERAQRGNLAGAREALEKSAEVDPTFADPRVALAQLALHTGDIAAARHWADAATAADPDDQNARQFAAMLDAAGSGAAMTLPSMGPASAPATGP